MLLTMYFSAKCTLTGIRQTQIGVFGVTVSEIVTVSESDIIVSESDTIISDIVS